MIRLQSVARRSVTNVLNLLSERLHRQNRSTENTTVLPSMSLPCYCYYPEVIKIYLYINIFMVILIHWSHILSHYNFFFARPIRVITKLPNSEQSNKGKVKTHKYINRQNQSTTENCENNSYKSVLVIFSQIHVFALIYPYFITIKRYCILKINRWS